MDDEEDFGAFEGEAEEPQKPDEEFGDFDE